MDNDMDQQGKELKSSTCISTSYHGISYLLALNRFSTSVLQNVWNMELQRKCEILFLIVHITSFLVPMKY